MTFANRSWTCALALSALLAAACEDDTAAPPAGVTLETPTPAPTPTATPAPTSTPTPTAIPCTAGTCEDPTRNTVPPERVEIRLYWVRPGADNVIAANCTADDAIPIGYTFAIDLTGRDAANKPTNGRGDVEWNYAGTDALVQIATGHRFQPKHQVLAVGDFQIQGVLDGVASPWLHLTFTNDPSSTPCGQP